MAEERMVWAYVAHRDGKFAGVIAGSLDTPPLLATPAQTKDWRKEVAKFCGDFIADGFEITRVYSREEYEALTGPMDIWHKKRESDGKQLPLFDGQELSQGDA